MRTLDMTQGKPYSQILRFAGPLFVGTLFQQVYNLVDTMIVGYGVGDSAVAAIGATSALYAVIVFLATGMNSGFGVIISRLFGAGKEDENRKAFATMVILDILVTVVLTIFSLPLLHSMLQWLDTPEEIYTMAYDYIFVILIGMIATIAYNFGAGFLRAIGNSQTPLYFLILSCGLNIAMDCLFVFGLHLGVVGAALATVIAEAFSAVCCIGYILKHYKIFLPRRTDWIPDSTLIREMLGTGVSMGLMLSVFSMGSIILQKGINQLGTDLITAHTASRRIYEVLMMPLSTIATATATFVSQNYGAGKMSRINEGMKQTTMIQLAWSAFSIMVAYLFGGKMIELLIGTSSGEIISNAVLNLRVCTVFFLPLGILLTLRNAMQPLGNKVAPVISSSIELFVKVIFSYMIIPRMGYAGVVITEPIIWVICCVYLLVIYKMEDKKYSVSKGVEERYEFT